MAREFSRFRLREFRLEHGYTHVKLARMIGMSDRTISNYECGWCVPSAGALAKLADALHCSVDDLYGNVRPGERVGGMQ